MYGRASLTSSRMTVRFESTPARRDNVRFFRLGNLLC
jgi:hypothetical protein